MPELDITVGDRAYTIACQPGEESHLKAAAKLLDKEAGHVTGGAGPLPESRVLLMAGLMLADQLEAFGDQTNYSDERVSKLEERIRELEKAKAALEADAKTAPAPDFSEFETIADAMDAAAEKLEAG